MEELDFVHTLAPLFYCTSRRELSTTTHYKHLREWNVVLAVTLTSLIYERYRVQLDAADFCHSETLADLYHCILAKR